MKDSSLRLQDKTVLLVGPFNGVSQAILRTMTEFGADVGLVAEHAYAGKFVESINEAREVHPEYGRAAHFGLPVNNEKQIAEALGRVAESLGRMDVLIDLMPMTWTAETDASALELRRILADKVIPFFQAKQRGRLIYLGEDASLDLLRTEQVRVGEKPRATLTELIETLAKKWRGQNITVNGLSVGVTEDFLLKSMPKSPSLKRTLEELQKQHPGTKLVEFHEIGLGAAYVASALSTSLTGHLLRLTHGFHL